MTADPEISSYITKEFLKETLENGLKPNNVQIENYTIVSIGGGGENYSSDIYRVSVKFRVSGDDKARDISLIVKHIRTGGLIRELLKELDVFRIEEDMYMKIIPRIEELVGDNSMMAPKCYHTSGEQNLYVLRDLKELGYEIGDRLQGLDEAHATVVLKKIGQLHAASMVMAKEDPSSVQRFNKGMFNEISAYSPLFKALFLDNFEHMISVIETWPDYEVITAKLKKIAPNFLELGVELFKPREGELRVLNHGDLWVNNFMFKYNSNKAPCDVAFFDLQISFYGSLGIDINYFINSSIQLDVLELKRYELLKVYYHSLKSTLEKLKFSPIPKWDDVRKEIQSKELYGLITFCGVLPLMTLDREASQNNSLETFEDADASSKNREIMFSSKRMVNTMKYALNRLDEIGVLDSL